MKFLDNLLNVLLRTTALRYLEDRGRRYAGECPRMAILSFDFIGHQIDIFGRYENAELHKLAEVVRLEKRTGAALDIGANIGNHSRFFAGVFSSVHAFEPNESIVPLLVYNVREQPNVTVHPFGASSMDTTVHAVVPHSNSGGGHVAREGEEEGGLTFELRRLDAVAELRSAPAIDFIKIDVEGHELDAIEGMADLIRSHGPLIAFEQHETQVRGGTTLVIERLRALNYRHFYEIRSGESRIPQSLPVLLRRILRLIEASFDDPYEKASLRTLGTISSRNYPMLLASLEPLKIVAAPTADSE